MFHFQEKPYAKDTCDMPTFPSSHMKPPRKRTYQAAAPTAGGGIGTSSGYAAAPPQNSMQTEAASQRLGKRDSGRESADMHRRFGEAFGDGGGRQGRSRIVTLPQHR